MRSILKQARKDKGLTQEKIASALNISTRHYQQIEAGTRTGNFGIWDKLEEILSIHQKTLRSNVPINNPL